VQALGLGARKKLILLDRLFNCEKKLEMEFVKPVIYVGIIVMTCTQVQ
jgi:hypothetical protein